MKFYTCMPAPSEVYPQTEGCKKFVQSPWCGEGYATKKDAMEHKKFFEKRFGIKFVIEKETL